MSWNILFGNFHVIFNPLFLKIFINVLAFLFFNFYLVLGMVVGSTFAVDYCKPESLHCRPGEKHVACNNNGVSKLVLQVCHEKY